MILSIIIINYNVRYFLEQCLISVQHATRLISSAEVDIVDNQCEIIVVDNQSQDDSLAYLQPRFPGVRFIANEHNTGFGRANNQALQISRGKYAIFLNPDTILPEDCLSTCIHWMEMHPEAGACGVRMIAGDGRFLPESRRGFPGPWASFYKLSGLTSLFPRSKKFAAYYMGHLPEKEISEAGILSGAFFFARKTALDKTGGFDEQFFMYAEDIDLSYRLQKAGYTNYYIPTTTLIHFKGESTQKDRRYIDQFYKAMIQFSDKHFRDRRPGWYRSMMKSAIRMRRAWAALAMGIKKKPLSDSPQSFFLKGDPGTCLALEKKLGPSYPLKKNEAEATTVILCQGPQFSFKAMIDAIQQPGNNRHFLFHAAGSSSIVGSDSKNTQGESIAW